MTQPSTLDKASALAHSAEQLRAYVRDALHNGLSFHDFETGLWQRVLQIGHDATEQFLQAQGSGDLGEQLTLPDGQQVQRLPDLHHRALTGVFGTFTLERVCYGSRAGQKFDFVPLDNRLQLPQGKFSYLLQDFDGLLDTEQPYEQVSATLQRILRFKQHLDSLHRQAQHLASFVEPFREQLPSPGVEEKPILVRSVDAKGVPMRVSADAPPIASLAHQRGPKTGRKKQAIVGAIYTVDPLVRTAEDVVEELFRQPGQPQPQHPKRPRPTNKRVLALLNEYSDEKGVQHDGMAEVFAWLQEQTEERDPLGQKEVINLCDGDERLWDGVAETGCVSEVDILDLLHVTQRLGEVVGLFCPVGSEEGQEQLRGWLLGVLEGKVKGVVRNMRRLGKERELSAAKKKELAVACAYLSKHALKMRYDEYLAKGYPIASGVIEGACRHYVKDRMERTGMSWSQAGAQAMLQLRSVALNGDWDDFQDFYRLRQTQRLYPNRHLLEEVAWPLAV